METLAINSTVLQSWRILKHASLSGQDAMRYDVELLNGIEQGKLPPTLRFYRFKEPTVSYGRLQQWKDISSLVPLGWPCVQRPTGGGVVYHEEDLCLSLCWPRGQAPMPAHPKDIYRWIHEVIREGLGNPFKMAGCADVCAPREPFSTRDCFRQPVGFDLLEGRRKVVGGAIAHRKSASLYQGSIQIASAKDLESRLAAAFQKHFAPG